MKTRIRHSWKKERSGYVLGSAGDLGVVGLDDGVRGVDEGGAGVGDGVDAARHECAATDGVAGAGELPEALGAVDGDVVDGAGVLGRVDDTEVVCTSSVVFQVSSEETGGELRLGVVVECLLRGGRD